MVQVLSHQSGPNDPDGIGDDVADGSGSHSTHQVGSFMAMSFLDDFCFYRLVEGEEEGMEYGNRHNIRTKT